MDNKQNATKPILYSEQPVSSQVLQELQEELKMTFSKEGAEIKWEQTEQREIAAAKTSSSSYVVYAADKAHFIHGVSVLVKRMREKADTEFAIPYSFDSSGLFLDSSRNAVATVETIKKMLRKLAVLGHNRFMLYMEDIYEIPEEPYFGAYRGKYTKKELREIDRYGQLLGV